MRDVVGVGVFGADGCDACVGGFAGFGEGVVAGVEVFALLVGVSDSVQLEDSG